MTSRLRTIVRALFGFLRVNSEPWSWFREFVTFLPGSVGMMVRVEFYRASLRGSFATMQLMAGCYIENPHKVSLGDHTTLGRNAWINGEGGLTVGANTGIGPGVVIHSANHRYLDRDILFREQGHEAKPVSIGEDVWIAAGAIILPGAEIGRGAVVMAGAVVSGPVEPYSVMGGIPARRVGLRTSIGDARKPD